MIDAGSTYFNDPSRSLVRALRRSWPGLQHLFPSVHSVAVAVFPVSAFGTLPGAHPFAVAHICKARFPYIHEVVGVDVSLVVIGPYAGAGRD